MHIVRHYCGHEAGVRNLKKALDRIFRKVVAKLEGQTGTAADETLVDPAEVAASEVEYQINTKNLERFLDIAPSDDSFYEGINS